ncbi:MAG: type II toxin-antitoxin system RelE/ParE family toxin [Gammaproteobacteria bacterium]|uniref:type II toxin-antitoxin system RelE/ParE family toxin n=1 Tax=Pseudomaricurvus alcaniphilus TaxID=1166482 RepID=UPI00140B909C|nr:type II toxin-antitoxin system RelE/ParE family toxin [Pseudomaricurvus alcaniphilus]MBR9910117.1 type II toxin-antitoxin system RelE/ParE family toxin [Gammaproteobacteria bacterium]NHN36634.1 type II toxin-antitoxin system RelE/ParE family toxin [Pseudomaricurvus alcaniphilus]
MTQTDLFYELSVEADRDIEDIFDYTAEEFGLDQAVAYVNAFDDVFVELLDNTELGRRRPEIREGLRSIAKESHIIFYRILKDRIRIIRILHGSRDLPKFLT